MASVRAMLDQVLDKDSGGLNFGDAGGGTGQASGSDDNRRDDKDGGAATDEAKMREAVQALTLATLRGLGVVDARARGLVVQAAWPKDEAA